MRARALVAAALLAACGREKAPEPFSVRDSAGARIATSLEPAWDSVTAWRVAPSPSLHIGGSPDPALLLSDVNGALRLPDGRIVVADGDALTLRFFSPDGALLRTVGRTGSGPGEFRGLRSIFLAGDSIGVVDLDLRRISLFDLQGSFGRVHTLRTVGAGAFPPVPIGRLGDGRFIAYEPPTFSTGDRPGLRRDSSRIYLMSAEGEPGERVLALLDDETMVFASDRFVSSRPLPFGRETTVQVRGGRLWTATADEYRIDEWDPASGRLVASVRWTRAPVPVDPAAVAELRDSMHAVRDRETAAYRELLDIVVQVYDEVEFPAVAPPHGTFRVDAGGRLWVKDYLAPRDEFGPSTWQVFDAGGRLLGAVGMPARFAPTDIGEDYVLGTWLDEDDVPHVLMYGLLKP